MSKTNWENGLPGDKALVQFFVSLLVLLQLNFSRKRNGNGEKADVRKLIERTGLFGVDLGVLDVGAPLTSIPFGPLATINFVHLNR